MRILKILIILLLINNPCFATIDLSGDADYISVPDDASLDVGTTKTFSLVAWVNIDAVTATRSIAGKGSIITGAQAGWDFHYNSGADNLSFVFTDTAGNNCQWHATTDLENTGWNHVAVVVETRAATCNNADVTIYVNGIDESATNVSSASSLNSDLDSAFSFNIGARRLAGSYASFWDNAITDVAFYHTSLTGSEVLSISSSRMKRTPLQTQSSNLVGYWPVDDFSDNTALNKDANGYKDISDNGNDGQGIDADGDSLNIAEELLSYPPN